MLADGRYEAFVVDATPAGEDGSTLSLDLAIVSGERKGEMVSVRARGLGRSATEVLGLPATLTVVGGTPAVVIDA